jgi:hypothetical protein
MWLDSGCYPNPNLTSQLKETYCGVAKHPEKGGNKVLLGIVPLCKPSSVIQPPVSVSRLYTNFCILPQKKSQKTSRFSDSTDEDRSTSLHPVRNYYPSNTLPSQAEILHAFNWGSYGIASLTDL